MDLVYHVDAMPARGTEAVVTDFEMTPGGGFNAMAAAHAAGIEVRLGGTLGRGPFAEIVAEALEGLDMSLGTVPRVNIDQGCCTVLLEPDGERSFVTWPGAEGQASTQVLAEIDLDEVDWVTLSGYSLHYPGSRGALTHWIAELPRQIGLIFDPSPMVGQLLPDILEPVCARANWISANQKEAIALTGKADTQEAAKALARDRSGAVVRLGAKGCLLVLNDDVRLVPPLAVDAIDTNGAGDCHLGSFIAELARGADPLNAARYANVAAALSTTRAGPAAPPTRDAVLAVLNP